jgi:hypothetical protein
MSSTWYTTLLLLGLEWRCMNSKPPNELTFLIFLVVFVFKFLPFAT